MSRLILALLMLTPSCLAQNLCEQVNSSGQHVLLPCPYGITWSNENLVYSSTATLSTTKITSRIPLSGNMTLAIGAGVDGQFKCIDFVHDSTSTHYTVIEPANMVGLFAPSSVAGKRNVQCFIYFASDGLWEASGPGVIGQ
jgi:hypothetical protein